MTLDAVDRHQQPVATAEAELQSCEAEAPRFQYLNAEKHRLGTITGENKPLLSPIRRLPLELLSAIFELCLPVDKGMGHIFAELKGTISLTPFSIATTCHYWRQVATSSPSLWSKIILDLDTASDGTADVLDVFLCRSGNHSLHIYLKLTEEQHPNYRITSLLAENASRISLLRLWGKSDPFQSMSNLQFPRLRTFGFAFGSADDEEQHLDPFPWLASASQLHSVLLKDVNMVSEFLNGIPNEHVQFLGTYDACVSQTFSILPRFSNAEEAWIVVEELGDDIQETITLSNIQTLTIYLPASLNDQVTDRVMIPYLSQLSLPSLSTLRLVDDRLECPTTWDSAVFRTFISRSELSNKLTTLELQGYIHVDPQELICSLQLLPAITCLSLLESPSHCLASPLLLKRLAIDEVELNSPLPALLPALTDLELLLSDHADRLPLLVLLVQSRSPQVKPHRVAALRRIWMILTSITGEESAADLAECRKLGVRVHAQVVSHADWTAWMENDACFWDSTFEFLF